jgi:hypothetical protein
VIFELVKECARLKTPAVLGIEQLEQLVTELMALERKAGPALVVDERHVLCPACNQVRGCVHLATEIQELRRQRRTFRTIGVEYLTAYHDECHPGDLAQCERCAEHLAQLQKGA